ncbi:MAG: ABC transporter permease [Shewanella sp.]
MESVISFYKNFFVNIYNKRDLLSHLIYRDVSNRYKGSFLGGLWSLLNPLLLLVVYTFVFSVVLKSKWGLPGEGKLDFAIVLFCGMILFNAYADATNRSPSLILDNKNYVKKVVFPLEIIPLIPVFSSFFTGLISLALLIIIICLVHGMPGIDTFLTPLLWIPLFMMTVGMSLIISSLGVYIRDLSQVVSLLNMVLMFLSPIFFPIEKIPEALRSFVSLNPLADLVTQTRGILIFHQSFDWFGFGKSLGISMIIFCIGIAVFSSLKKGFSDVI